MNVFEYAYAAKTDGNLHGVPVGPYRSTIEEADADKDALNDPEVYVSAHWSVHPDSTPPNGYPVFYAAVNTDDGLQRVGELWQTRKQAEQDVRSMCDPAVVLVASAIGTERGELNCRRIISCAALEGRAT